MSSAALPQALGPSEVVGASGATGEATLREFGRDKRGSSAGRRPEVPARRLQGVCMAGATGHPIRGPPPIGLSVTVALLGLPHLVLKLSLPA